MEQDEDQEIFQNLGMEIDEGKSEDQDQDQEMEDTRPVQEILSELAHQARNSLNKYYNAVTLLESVLKNIDDSKELHIKVYGVKKKFREFIEECANKSKKKIKEENCINFGELLLKGLQDSS